MQTAKDKFASYSPEKQAQIREAAKKLLGQSKLNKDQQASQQPQQPTPEKTS